MLAVIGGLAVAWGQSPLAAQTTGPSATRSIEPEPVLPDGTITVKIDAEGYSRPARVTENLPSGFEYVANSLTATPPSALGTLSADSDEAQGTLIFNLVGVTSLTYQVTAPSAEGSSDFSGSLTDPSGTYPTGGDRTVTVSSDTDPAPVGVGDLQFDVVPAKAVKGAVVSGLHNPIGSNPLEWTVDTGGAAVTIAGGGAVGEDFRVAETSEGSGKFQLLVEKSRAPALSGTLSGTQAISVDVTYEVDGADVTETLTGNITARDPLVFTNSPFDFTIAQSTNSGTLIGAFVVSGGITGEYLDGIVTGSGSELFDVRDSDMTLVYNGSSGLEVGTYNLDLTVSGDAGLANRTIIGEAQVTVTASNIAPSAPPTFAVTILENEVGEGLVEAVTPVGDASEGVSANDGDSLRYSLEGAGASVFDIINPYTGMITVGSAGIADSADGGDVTFEFEIIVSDGISANNQSIDATVTVDANEFTELVAAEDLPANVVAGMIDHDSDDATAMVEGYKIAVSVTDGDVPTTLVDLGDLVVDADGDDLSFDVSGNPSHIVYDRENA